MPHRKSRSLWKSGLVFAALCVLFARWAPWKSTQGDEVGRKLINPSPSAIIGTPSKDTRIAPLAPRAFADHSGVVRVQLFDAQTHTGVGDADLLDCSGASLGKTGSDGLAELARSDYDKLRSASVNLLSGPALLGLESPTEVLVDTRATYCFAIAVYTRFEIRMIVMGGSVTKVAGRVMAFPDLPSTASLSNEHNERLRFNRCTPDVYLELLHDFGILRGPSDQAFVVDVRDGVGTCSIYVPVQGPTVVLASAPGLTVAHGNAHASRGQVVHVELELRGTPVVSGRLTDVAGHPIADGMVAVTCKAVFGHDEIIPCDRKQAGGPAFTLRGPRGGDHKSVFATRRCRSGADGSWSASVPITQEVAAYAFVQGADRVIERRSVGLFDSVSGVNLRAVPSDESNCGIIVDASTGCPISDCCFSILQNDPPDPLQIHYPKLACDSNGRFPLGWFDTSAGYFLSDITAQGVKYTPLEARFKAGCKVQCWPSESRKAR